MCGTCYFSIVRNFLRKKKATLLTKVAFFFASEIPISSPRKKKTESDEILRSISEFCEARKKKSSVQRENIFPRYVKKNPICIG